MNPQGHFLQKLAGLGGRPAKELYHTELIAQLKMNISLEEIHRGCVFGNPLCFVYGSMCCVKLEMGVTKGNKA